MLTEYQPETVIFSYIFAPVACYAGHVVSPKMKINEKVYNNDAKMAPMCLARTSLLLCLLILPTLCGAIKLNVPRVLLPYSQTVSANFSLEVTGGGCFNWQNSRPDVIRIHVLDEEGRGCSERAVVSSTSRVATLQNALITLVNDANGETFHFDVTVASIHTLEITTTTKELLLEDTPEAITLIAKDQEGDTFSSLDGLVFDWTPVTDVDSREVVDAQDVVRSMKFTESSYKASSSIYALEAQGKRGYKVLVQGIKTGMAKLRATLKDAAYTTPPLSAEISLTVVANLVLQPSYEVRLLVGSLITYQVMLIQQGKAQRIPMPSDQFYLTVADETVGRLDPATSQVEGLAIGYTTIVLKDRNVKAKQVFRQPIAGIHVVQPHHLGFVVLPHRNWFLTHGHQYTVLVKVYDRDNNEVYHTDNIRVATTFPADYLTVQARTQNGTWFQVHANRPGKFTLTAKLEGVLGDSGGLRHHASGIIEGTQDVEILDQVTVTPELLVMPWNPVTKPSFRFKFDATGGGTYGYHWSSNDPTISSCSQNGEIQTKRDGDVNVTVCSARNPRNLARAAIRIVLPDALEILESAVEVEVGAVLKLPVALYMTGGNGARLAFTECTQYALKVEVADPDKLDYAPHNFSAPAVQGSCADLHLLAKAGGFTRVHATAQGRDGDIKAAITVGIYRPLTVISPLNVDDGVVVAVGSAAQLVFQGGPWPWFLYPQSYVRRVSTTNDSVLSALVGDDVDPKHNDLHVVTVLCTELGDVAVTLLVGNRASSTNGRPVAATARVRVLCAVPAVMELHPLVHRPPGLAHLACPVDKRRVSVQCYRQLEIALLVRDDRGRLFDNFTSLAVAWESSDTSLAAFQHGGDRILLTEDNVLDGYRTVNRSYQVLFPKGVEGPVKVTATLAGYRSDVLRAAGIRAGAVLDTRIVASVYLDLVDDAVFEKESLSVFNHPQNKASLLVLKGSGQFDYEPKDQAVAGVLYDEKRRVFQVAPKSEGRFVLELYDVCLESRSRASVAVRVSGIRHVEVRMTDKVGLDREITAHVRVLDYDGGQLPTSVFALLDVRAQHFSNVVSVRQLLPDVSTPPDAFRFAIKGNLLGHTSLTFTVGPKVGTTTSDGLSRSSEPQPIQVFSPLRLHPRNVTLLVGAVFQVSSSGGPLPEAGIEFVIEDAKTALVSNAGLIEGLTPGNSVVTGRAVGVDGEASRRIVHSQDQISVYVVQLTGIQIRVPATRLRAGAIVPVYAVGTNEQETPFAFGTTTPHLVFRWTISNDQVASLQPPFEGCGVWLGESNHFMTRLTAKQQGQITLILEVTSTAAGAQFAPGVGAILRDEVHIQVFEPLQLLAPPVMAEGIEITVTPNTDYQIRTNKDQHSRVTYRTINSSCNGDLSVDGGGHLKSGLSFCGAHLVLTSLDELDTRLTLVASVAIKPIQYLMVTALCSLHTSGDERLTVLPIGTQNLFQVQFFDDVGKEFQATNSRLRFMASRRDLTQVMQGPRNNTFFVTANDPGQTVLRVWDAENPGVEDFLLLATGEVMHPASPVVTLGDLICFQCPLTSENSVSGVWRSESPHVVRVIADSGVAFAADVGTAVLVYTVSGMTTSTRVTVLPVLHLAIQSSAAMASRLLTNAKAGREFVFPLLLQSERSSVVGSNLHGSNCSRVDLSSISLPFRCDIAFRETNVSVSATDVFDVEARFNIKSGNPECVVTSRTLSAPLTHQLSAMSANVELTATVPRRSTQEALRSELVSVPFEPAFHLEQVSLAVGDAPSGKVNSAGGAGVALLTVSASKRAFQTLQVRSNDSRVLTVTETTASISADQRDSRHYQVALADPFWSLPADELPTVQVEVTCSLIGQVAVVPVSLKISGDSQGKCPTDRERQGWGSLFSALIERYQLLLTVVLTVVATIIALYIGYHALVGQKYYAAGPQAGVFLNRSGIGDGRMYPPGSMMSSTAERTHLWSVNEPVHGSPFNRSTSPIYRFNNSE